MGTSRYEAKAGCFQLVMFNRHPLVNRNSSGFKALFTFRNCILDVKSTFLIDSNYWTFRPLHFLIALILWQLLSYSNNQSVRVKGGMSLQNGVWHNYAECNICRMTQRNNLNWQLRRFGGPINSQAAAFLIGNLRNTTTTWSTTTGSELQCTAQARPVNFVVVMSIVKEAKQSRIKSSCNLQASAGINPLF